MFVWITGGKCLSVGDVVAVTGTVRDHSEYKGVKQTNLTRCKL